MSKTKDALDAFVANWRALKATRPTEAKFGPYGFPNISYEALDEVFGRWTIAIDALEGRGSWVTSPEAAVADHPLGSAINDLSSLVTGAIANGINWLISSGFLTKVSDVQNLISSISARRISITREVARELSTRGHAELEGILAAEKAAKTVIAFGKTVEDSVAAVQQALDSVRAAEQHATTSGAEVTKVASDAAATAITIGEARAKIEAAHRSIEEMKIAADTREAALEARASDLSDQIKTTQSAAETALHSVQEALRAVRSQGLAQAFQARSDTLRAERRLWTILFVGAIAILTVVSITFSIELSRLTYETLAVSMLRKIAVAGPAVWLGWYSAKQVGRVARVQEDYEYKAASALAFQSYKEETMLGGDTDLLKQLLKNAITTFGENPVRLYGELHADTVTPVEAALKNLPPEAIAAMLATVGARK